MDQDPRRTPADTQTRTSTTLLERVALTGDEPACAQFVARYEPMVKGIAARRGLSAEDCDDVAQEVMIAAITALREHRYDRQVGRFKTWLKGVIFHKISHALQARSHHRAGRAGGASHGAAEPGAAPPAPMPSDSSRPAPNVAGQPAVPRTTPYDPIIPVPTPRPLAKPGVPLEEIPDPHPPPDQQFEADFETEWQKVAFEEALDEVRREVDPLTYQAFDLYARKNLPAGEVAKLLGLYRNAVYIAKTRILARLREKLADLGE